MEHEPNFERPKSGAEIADLLRQEYGIDADICDDISVMDAPDAYRAAYEVLDHAGQNPDAILAPYMEEPDL